MILNMDKQQTRLLRPVQVSHVSDINERMKRVYLTGESVAAFSDALPASWVKVFFTPPQKPEGPGRAYTIRYVSQAENLLALDFVQHGEGPAASWSRSAQSGDIIRVAGPREGVSVAGVKSILLFGDETAIPGIFAIIEALDEHASVQAFIVKDSEACYALPDTCADLSVAWLDFHEDLAGLVNEWVQENTPELIWGAGEHSIVIPLRRHLFQAFGRSRKDTHITAYWKSGEADHHDTPEGIPLYSTINNDF